MEVNFKQESPDKTPYCDCNCGEYRQYISGFFRHPDYGGGPARLQEHRIAYGRLLDPSDPREDGDKKGNPYGHRYEDAARTSLRPNNDPNDRFLHDRETAGNNRVMMIRVWRIVPRTMRFMFISSSMLARSMRATTKRSANGRNGKLRSTGSPSVLLSWLASSKFARAYRKVRKRDKTLTST